MSTLAWFFRAFVGLVLVCLVYVVMEGKGKGGRR